MSDEKEKIYEIVVVGDENDADYITAIHDITMKDIERFKPLIAAIAAHGEYHNWQNNYDRRNRDDYFRKLYAAFGEELISEFDGYCPGGEYGIHTIESIVYYEKPTKIILL